MPFFRGHQALGEHGNDVLLASELLLELSGLALLSFEGELLRIVAAVTTRLQGEGGVLEQLLTPLVEDAGLEAVLLWPP